MKQKLVRFAAIAFLIAVGMTQTRAHDPLAEATAGALAYACGAMKADCTDIKAPRVVFADLGGSLGTIGYDHMRQEFVLVLAPQLVNAIVSRDTGTASAIFAYSVLVHETVHFLDVVLGTLEVQIAPNGGVYGSAAAICESEARAWHVGNLFLLEHGQWKQARWGWRRSYPHCQV